MTRSRALTLDTPSPRARSRSEAPAGATPEMVQLARESFEANKIANAKTAIANAKSKALFKLMAAADLTSFRLTGQTANGGLVPVLAIIEETVVDEISVDKLRSLVSDETFMALIKAAKGAVQEAAGEHIAIKALNTVVKPPSLKIREIKV